MKSFKVSKKKILKCTDHSLLLWQNTKENAEGKGEQVETIRVGLDNQPSGKLTDKRRVIFSK